MEKELLMSSAFLITDAGALKKVFEIKGLVCFWSCDL